MSKRLPTVNLSPQRLTEKNTPPENSVNPRESLATQGNEEKHEAVKSRYSVNQRLTEYLTIPAAAELTGKAASTIRESIKKGKYPNAEKRPTNGGEGWFIPLRSLPLEAQARYWKQGSASVDAPPAQTMEERDALWRRWETATPKIRARAERALRVLHFLFSLLLQGVSKMEAYATVKAEFAVHRTALDRWRTRIEGVDKGDWLPALIPDLCGRVNCRVAEWGGNSRQFFVRQITPGRTVKAAYDATVREAARQGWGKLPSYRTAQRYWESIPDPIKAEMHGDKKAQKRLSPTITRDYSGFALHEQWSMDGRRLDVMTKDAKGIYGQKGWKGRLWFYAVMDMRTRYLVGYAYGRELNASLARAALLNAFETTGRVIPQSVQVDNGMEAAAKEITGGAPWRRRGKVKEDEIIGMLPRLGIEISWATPAHGQTKPIERLFGTLAGMVETRPEFRKSYMGSNPQARPEEYDPKHAAPVEALTQAYKEEIDRYHCAPHRGSGMDGKTPLEVYTGLVTAPGFIARKMSSVQYRMCALAAQKVVLLRNGMFTIHGARYQSRATCDAPKGDLGYYVLYDENNLTAPVFLYRRNKLVAANVPQIMCSYGQDKATAEAGAKARKLAVKQVKAGAAALLETVPEDAALAKALRDAQPTEEGREANEMRQKVIAPAAKVTALIPPRITPIPPAPTPEEDAERERIIALMDAPMLTPEIKRAFR